MEDGIVRDGMCDRMQEVKLGRGSGKWKCQAEVEIGKQKK
jgi:hypothetical protein